MDSSHMSDSERPVPLVLDVDGTLLRTDLLFETFWAALGEDVRATLRTVAKRIGSPAHLKAELAAIAMPTIDLLPLRDSILALARSAEQEGRPVHLVSGSDQHLVDALAARLDLPGPHFGSHPPTNLTGAAKSAFLKEQFGVGGFDYAGNDRSDLHAWQLARKVIAVDPTSELKKHLQALGKPVEIISERRSPAILLHEMRPHHWVKNLLLFIPILVTHQLESASLLNVALAAMAFSLGASSIYILNDLLDLNADRRHPEKCNRPIAKGTLPIPTAMIASPMLALAALTLALAAGPPVAALTLLYMTGSLTYSLWLKKFRWLDVIALASLFLLRILAGAVAAGVILPPVLLAFGFTVFFVLACVKRMTALSRTRFQRHLPRRGYSSADLRSLQRTAYAAVCLATVLHLIYVISPGAADLYDNRWLLALAAVPIMIWLYRIVRLSVLGQEDYDPVRFILRDKPGTAIVLFGVTLILLAI